MLLHKIIVSLADNRETGMTAVRLAKELLEHTQGEIQLGGGVIAQVCHGVLYVRKDIPAEPFVYPLDSKGIFLFPDGDKKIVFTRVEKRPEQFMAEEAYLRYEEIKGKKLVLRSRREGDYFYPVGMEGKRKVKDFFIDKKIPRFLRDSIPLLVADDEIVWVVGQRVDARYAAEKNDTDILRIAMEKSISDYKNE